MNDIKIRLLRNEDNDYKLLTKWYQQKEIYSMFEQRILNYEEIKTKYYPRTLKSTKVPVYMIEYNNIPVGIIQYKLIDNEDKKIYKLNNDNIYELDIFIGEISLHHKGIGTKAIELLSNMLFNDKEAKLLVMCPLKSNIKAIDCYKKCGFRIKDYFDTKDTIGNVQTYALMLKERK